MVSLSRLGLILGPLLVTEALSVPRINARVLTVPEDLRESYDYVIVGGGTAGLTVGDRLSEDLHSKLAATKPRPTRKSAHCES